MNNLMVINLMAGPGVGKSTFASRLFVALKEHSLNVELNREYPKDLVWEERHVALSNQIKIFAEQHHMLWVLKDKVDIVVVEGSLLNSLAYTDNDILKELVLTEFNKFNNKNYFLERKVDYQLHGRKQNEEEAIEKDNIIKSLLDINKIEYTLVDPLNPEQFKVIVNDIFCNI